MIYILTLLLSLYLMYIYDIRKKTKFRNLWYKILCLWLITLSGFQYMMGTDIQYYMADYSLLRLSDLSISSLIDDMANRRQPGWMLYLYFCRIFTDNFLLPKLIQAIFLNIAVFSFFKRETRTPFIGIFVYLLFGALVLNFNVLRHSFAIGFSLYALSFLKKGNLKLFLVFIGLAYLFHNSALVLLSLPIVIFLIDKLKSPKLFVFLILGFLYLLNTINMEDIMLNFLIGGYIGEDMTNIGLRYITSERQGIQDTYSLFSLQRLMQFFFIFYYLFRSRDSFWSSFGFLFIIISILSGFMPILWRFRLYFDFGYYLIVSYCISNFYRENLFTSIKVPVLALCIIILSYFPIRDYVTPYKGSSYRYIDQYYPYSSILFPHVDNQKNNYFFDL